MNTRTEGTASNTPLPSFLQLLDIHGRLDELFLCHQEALLQLDPERAGELLEQYEAGLRKHIRVEEELLLPVYRRAGPIPGGASDLFTSEHRKMLAFVEQFRDTLARLKKKPPDLKRQILALFDQQASFKQLVEHHDLREHNILYPTLDQVTEAPERRELFARCCAEVEGQG